jgi:acyl-CoA thioesterase
MRFAEASAVERIGEDTWRGEVQPNWDIFGIANGGYLMAIASRAMSDAAGGRLPVSVTSHFTKPVSAGPIEMTVEPIKVGRTYSTIRASLTSGPSSHLSMIATLADPDRPDAGTRYMAGEMPEMPSPLECVRAMPSPDGPLPPPLMAQFEERIHPEDAAALEGKATGVARVRGWFRLLDDEPLDPFAPLLVADAFPPAIFNARLPLSWTPTVEMTTHIRSTPETGWLCCQFTTRFVTGGFLEEDGEVWDEGGRLVALSRQLALVPR